MTKQRVLLLTVALAAFTVPVFICYLSKFAGFLAAALLASYITTMTTIKGIDDE